jgi:hypothetical protein
MAFYMRHNEIPLFGKENLFFSFFISLSGGGMEESGPIESLANDSREITKQFLKETRFLFDWKAASHPLNVLTPPWPVSLCRSGFMKRENDEVKRGCTESAYLLYYTILALFGECEM